MFVLDTNTVIHFFKGAGNVATRLLATPPSQVGVPAVVAYELETGLAKCGYPVRRVQELGLFLSAVSLLPFGVDEARAAAGARARLEAQGTPIGPMDILIAGTALARGAILVTRNVREFSRVSGLVVENWY
ncbi:type II toxin-antitoxin system VapC family toxin [Desulfolutivibrio sulfodismutans]|nr:type II toxin-antitoxin system VapC family toxin [Desulfolutivibrio sulfodismutans]